MAKKLPTLPPPRCVREGGLSLHADVSVPARDRHRVERLCRYVVRPPLAIERLEATSDGRLTYRCFPSKEVGHSGDLI